LEREVDRLLDTKQVSTARLKLEHGKRTVEERRAKLEDAVLDGTFPKSRGKVKLAEIEATLQAVEAQLATVVPTRVSEAKPLKMEVLKRAREFAARPGPEAWSLLPQWLGRRHGAEDGEREPLAALEDRGQACRRALPAGSGTSGSPTASPGRRGSCSIFL